MTDDALERVLESLDLEVLDRDLLLGDPGPGEGRLFGGLVAAQSVVAAGRTVEAGDLHSLHAYFLRPGRYGSPIRFVVDRIRDGRTFTTRRVVAHQDGEAIFNLSASFARPDAGVAHQAEAAPEAPGPEGMIEWAELRARWWGHAIPKAAINEAIEVRVSEEVAPPSAPGMPPQRFVWLRPRGTQPGLPVREPRPRRLAPRGSALRRLGSLPLPQPRRPRRPWPQPWSHVRQGRAAHRLRDPGGPGPKDRPRHRRRHRRRHRHRQGLALKARKPEPQRFSGFGAKTAPRTSKAPSSRSAA